jgi:hypothetical protein
VNEEAAVAEQDSLGFRVAGYLIGVLIGLVILAVLFLVGAQWGMKID